MTAYFMKHLIFKYRKTLSGSTLTEVLVVMIVAGIVFLSVMDGFGLFRRHTINVAGRITENSRFYEGYYRLEDLITNTDSITQLEQNSRVVCWRGGAETATIISQDSMLICYFGAIRDTLMRSVESLRAVHEARGNMTDSLVVAVRTGEKSLIISFAMPLPAQKAAVHSIMETEKQYEYE